MTMNAMTLEAINCAVEYVNPLVQVDPKVVNIKYGDEYFVIGDIHGRMDLLNIVLKWIYTHPPTEIIFLGDYIDRGPDSALVCRTIMEGKEGWKFTPLRGNHEQMYVDDQPYDPRAIMQLLGSENYHNEFHDWFDSLPLSVVKDDNIFAHAAYDVNKSQEEQDPEFVLWHRYYNDNWNGDGKYLTHGHTPSRGVMNTYKHRLNLDTGAFASGVLGVATFCEGMYGPRHLKEIKFDQ